MRLYFFFPRNIDKNKEISSSFKTEYFVSPMFPLPLHVYKAIGKNIQHVISQRTIQEYNTSLLKLGTHIEIKI